MLIKDHKRSIVRQTNGFRGLYNHIISSMMSLKIDKSAGKTASARYCYAVWLRHIVMMDKGGLPFPVGSTVELGPGNSIGIGLAAMLSGIDRYYALDVERYTSHERDSRILDELIELFKRREPIPGMDEFPRLKPYLDSYDFPSYLLTNDHLRKSLDIGRVHLIRRALRGEVIPEKDKIGLYYFAPWRGDPEVISGGSVDMIYSQAVMEHVDDLLGIYRTFFKWLRPQGFMCHQIDFKSHGISKEWNGHWRYHDPEWEEKRNGKTFLINREPYSTHIDLMRQSGFKVLLEKKIKNASEQKAPSCIKRADLAPRFRGMTEDDFSTSGAYVQAVKLNSI